MELMQVTSEIEPVLDIFRALKPERVLEIGCWEGGTLKLWLENVAAGGEVVAVDDQHRMRNTYADLTPAGVSLHVYTGLSQTPEMVDAMRAHAPYDWVFIDGDHDYGPARADVDATRPLIRAGGVMVLHDITPPTGSDHYGPELILAELEAEGLRTARFQDPAPAPWSRGLGVVYL